MSQDLPDQLPTTGYREATGEPAKRETHEGLARRLGISDKTVREWRKRGLSDREIEDKAAVNSRKHDPLKFKRSEPPAQPPAQRIGEDQAPVAIAAPRSDGGSVEADIRGLDLRLKQIQVAEKEGQLVDRVEATFSMASILTATHESCRQIGPMLCSRLAAMESEREIAQLIERAVDERFEAAKVEVDKYWQSLSLP